MKCSPRQWLLCLGLLLALMAVPFANGVLFVSTGDSSYNTNAPTGSLTNSGWQYEGQWMSYLGTPIAPTFFLAAQHIGGTPGTPFILNGFSYTTVTNFDDPNTDLRIWQVAQTFPYYAPLYAGSNEVGQACVVIGRGTQRGSLITTGAITNGWMWGAGDSVERWGENTVSGVYTDATRGQLLFANFDQTGGSNVCDLSVGDSSGGMFIQNGSQWALAGLHYAVDGPFSYDGTSTTEFDAALIDLRGLYYYNGSGWTLEPLTNPVPVPSAFYSTRVSARLSWINSVVNNNLGNDLGIAGLQIVGSNAQINLITGSNRFYRVDYTTNLVNAVWITLTNNIPGAGTNVVVTDPGVLTTQPARFYRATVLP